MMILALPPENLCHDDWKDFKFALKQHNLTIVKMLEETNDYVKVEINTRSDSDEQVLIELMKLCFGDYYCV